MNNNHKRKVNVKVVDIHGTTWEADGVNVYLLEREGIIKVRGDGWTRNFVIANLIWFQTERVEPDKKDAEEGED